MTDPEIKQIVSQILKDRLAPSGFESADVSSEADFDGASIIRVKAHFAGHRIPSDQLVETIHAIRSKLIAEDEGRFVYLDAFYPEDEAIDEEVE